MQKIQLDSKLQSLPLELHYRHKNTKTLRGNVHRLLNHAILTPSCTPASPSSGFSLASLLFPNIDTLLLPIEYNVQVPVKPHQFFEDDPAFLEALVPHNGLCGRQFLEGEPVYRCIDCGFDDTCVLCVRCFNKDDHQGHAIVVSLAAGESRGCCDCGDPEAWTKELHCKLNHTCKPQKKDRPLEEELEKRLDYIVGTVFDHVIQTYLYSYTSLAFYVQKMRQSDRFEFSLAVERSCSVGTSDEEDPNSLRYILFVWNDEYHSFPEAKYIISKVDMISDMRAKDIATDLDAIGRGIIAEDSLPIALYDSFNEIAKARSLRSEGMTPSVVRVDRYMDELVGWYAIEWLLNVLKHPSDAVRTAAERSVEKKLSSACYFEPEDEFENYETSERFEMGVLENGRLPGVDERPTFLDLIMYFDPRFFKAFRLCLRDVLMNLTAKSASFKSIFAERYMLQYGHMLQNMSVDREIEHNIVLEVHVQIWSSPLYVNNALEQGGLAHFIGALKKLILQSAQPGYWELPSAQWQRVATALYQKAVLTSSTDLAELAEKAPKKKPFYEEEAVKLLTSTLGTLQGLAPFERRVGSHVEVEDLLFLDIIPLLNYILKALSCAYNGAEYPQDVPDSQFQAVVSQTLQAWYDGLLELIHCETVSFHNNQFSLYRYPGSKRVVSICKPLNLMLLMLLENGPENGLAFNGRFGEYNTSELFFRIARSSLSLVIFCAQVFSRFWVRNGHTIREYADFYARLERGLHLSAHGYIRDIHLVQVALLKSPDFFVAVLDAWELLDCFSGEELESGIYKDKFPVLLYEFILFLHRLIVERKSFTRRTSQQKRVESVRYLVIYLLGQGPLRYLDLLDQVLVDDSSALMSKILSEVADYKPPVGMNDSGTYLLKPKEFVNLDPYSIFASSSESLLSNMRRNLFEIEQKQARREKRDPIYSTQDEVIFTPIVPDISGVYANYTDFLREKPFQITICQVLQWCARKNSNHHALLALHMLHAVLIDNEKHEADLRGFYKQLCFCLCDLHESDIGPDSKALARYLFGKLHREEYGIPSERVKGLQSGPRSSDDSRKKMIAEKKARAFAKLAAQRKAFGQANTAVDSEDEAPELSERTCVICQQGERENDLFVVPVGVDKHHAFAYSNETALGLEAWSNDVVLGRASMEKPTPSVRSILSLCDHAVHESCDKSMPGLCVCPMCKFRGDAMFPCLPLAPLTPGFLDWLKNIEGPQDLVSGLLEFLEGSSEKAACGPLHNLFFGGGHFVARVRAEMILQLANETLLRLEIPDSLQKLSSFLENGISTLEISTRFVVDDSDPYASLLDIPEVTCSFLRLVAAARVGKGEKRRKEAAGSLYLLVEGVLLEHFLFGFMMRAMYAREIAWIIKGVFNLMSDAQFERVEALGADLPLKEDVRRRHDSLHRALSVLIEPDSHKLLRGPGEDFIAGLLVIVTRSVLVFLRRAALFLRILGHDKENKEVHNALHQLMEELEDAGVENGDSATIDPYLVFFGLDSVADVIEKAGSDTVEGAAISSVFEFPGAPEVCPIEYPGVRKLIPLPEQYDVFATNVAEVFSALGKDTKVSDRIDYYVCLHCGERIDKGDHNKFQLYLPGRVLKRHFHKTNHKLYFFPASNTVKVVFEPSDRSVSIYTQPAPYLNNKGESGETALREDALMTLSERRYRHIVRTYLRDGFTGITRRSAQSSSRQQFFDAQRLREMLAEVGPEGMGGLLGNIVLMGGPPVAIQDMTGSEDDDDEPEQEVMLFQDDNDVYEDAVEQPPVEEDDSDNEPPTTIGGVRQRLVALLGGNPQGNIEEESSNETGSNISYNDMDQDAGSENDGNYDYEDGDDDGNASDEYGDVYEEMDEFDVD